MSNPGPETLHVRLQQDDDWPPVDREDVLGERVGDHLYRILSAPAFAKRLSVDDVVKVSYHGASDLPWVDAVVERGSRSTIRVMLLRRTAEGDLTSALAARGCRVSAAPVQGLLTVDVPEAADYSAIRKFLEDGEKQGDWEFQEAAVSIHHEPGTSNP